MSGPRTRRMGATGRAAGPVPQPTGMMGNERVGIVKKAPHHVAGVSALRTDQRSSASTSARERVA